MDHLPHPQDAAFPPVIVPYYDKYKYDGGSFVDYPSRCGFDKTEFIYGNFSTVPPDDHNSFFQAWLFFGLIYEFFGAVIDEFIDHKERRVTTARLPYWAAKWQQSLPIFSRSKAIVEWERVSKCLREVRGVITKLEFRQHLSEEVSFSIIALGLTLNQVPNFRNSYSRIGRMKVEDRLSMLVDRWPTSEFARKRLEAAGWCKAEHSRLQTYMFDTGILYCGSMRSFGRTIDHSRCSKDQCAAENINEETYKTAHAEGCEGCQHDGPIVSDLASTLIGKSFPVIGLTKSKITSDIRISVLPHRKSMAYTAISHVWADGLGNPLGNTLPQCQIQRLFQLVQSNNLSSGGLINRILAWMPIPSSLKTNTVYLWIDTLCVPLEKEFHKKAISLMYNAYKEAKTVLVLDRSLFSISAERPTEELCFRITASPWMRRAWTLQEGTLARTLYVQFADKAINAYAAHRSLFKRTEGTNSYKVTLLESCSAIGHLYHSRENEGVEQLNLVLRGLMHRSTSHLGDKQICLAIMTRCDMDRIMDAEGDLRTQQIYQQLKYIPRPFLWHEGPSLDIPGFRWAPKDIFSISPEEDDGLSLSERGLLVVAHGMVYFGGSLNMTHSAPLIRDFISGTWYHLRWLAGKSFDVAMVIKSGAPWTTLAVILKRSVFFPTETGVVIRINWNPSVAPTPEDLSNYLRCCDTISGEYIGKARLEELNHIETNRLEQERMNMEKSIDRFVQQQKMSLEDLPLLNQRLMFEQGDSFWFQGEMRGSKQKWLVT